MDCIYNLKHSTTRKKLLVCVSLLHFPDEEQNESDDTDEKKDTENDANNATAGETTQVAAYNVSTTSALILLAIARPAFLVTAASIIFQALHGALSIGLANSLTRALGILIA